MKLKTRVVGFGTVVGIATVYVILSVSVKAPVESSAENPINELKSVSNRVGHLNVLRKDLDISNSTGDSAGLKEAVSLANLSDSQLMDYLRRSDALKNKDLVNSILRVAHTIEKYRDTRPEHKALNDEFVPDQEEDPGRGSERREADARAGRGEGVRPASPSRERDSAAFRTKLTDIAPNKSNPSLVVDLHPDVVKGFIKIVDAMSEQHRKRKRRRGPSLNLYPEGPESPSWERFHNRISQYELYSEEDGAVDELLKDLASLPITHTTQKTGGTQLKLTFTFSDHSRAMWKPMRFPRDRETLPDHTYFVDFERHNAEIAAFHLDRVLGFRRVVPTVGREINVTHDVKRLVSYDVTRTFFVSPAGNICFHGKCDYYCDTAHAVCGHPEFMEGSFAAYLPTTTLVRRKTWRNPWRRSYHKRRLADWQTDEEYCEAVRATPPYNSGRRMLDLIDLSAFDFLTGNMDRHHYETFLDFGNITFLLALDNGRGFGKMRHDQIDILAPLYQCCLLRYSTFEKFNNFDTGPTKLSEAVRKSLTQDPVNPVLAEGHLTALDRRVKIILNTVNDCIARNDGEWSSVIIDDGF